MNTKNLKILNVINVSSLMLLAVLTRNRSIVSNKSSQVQRLAVNVQLLHTANKLPGAKREVVRYIGNSAEKQRTSQVQRPETGLRGRVNKKQRKGGKGRNRGLSQKH